MRWNKTAENAAWLMAGRMAQMGVSLAVGVLTTRYLGPRDYGLLQYAAAYTAFFAPLASLGLPSVLVKELTDTPKKEGEILGTALVLRGMSAIMSAFGIICLILVTEGENETLLAVAGLSCAAMVLQAFDVFQQWLQFRLLSRVTALISLTAYLLGAGMRVWMLAEGKEVGWFALAGLLETFCAGGSLLLSYHFRGGGELKISREMALRLLRKSIHFLLPGLMVSVYAQTDKIMLGWLMGQQQTGYYAAAVSVCNAWCFVLSSLIEAVHPGLAILHRTDKSRYLEKNRQLYGMIFYISAAVSAILCCFAEPITVFLYGKDFLTAAAPVRILTWYTGFSYLGVARNIWLVCENRQVHLLWVYAAAAGTNVVLNCLLIPLWGASGAAAASLTAQVVTVLVIPFCIPALRENGRLMLEGILLQKLGKHDHRKGRRKTWKSIWKS